MAAATKSSEPGNHAKPYLFGASEKGGNLSKPDFFGAVRRAGPHKTSMFWQGGEVVAVEYVVDKKLLSYRSKRVKPVLSDEQRAAARARLQTMREKRLQANG